MATMPWLIKRENRGLSLFSPGAYEKGEPGWLPFGRLSVRSDSGEVGFDEGPVNQGGEEGFDELGTQVAVVDVVGVFPDVDAEQGLVAGINNRGQTLMALR